jgi:hypothetical protein
MHPITLTTETFHVVTSTASLKRFTGTRILTTEFFKHSISKRKTKLKTSFCDTYFQWIWSGSTSMMKHIFGPSIRMAAVRRLQGLGFGPRTRRAADSRCQGHLHPSPSKCFLSVNRVFYSTVTRLAEKVHTFDRSETFRRCCVSDHVKCFNDAVLVTT